MTVTLHIEADLQEKIQSVAQAEGTDVEGYIQTLRQQANLTRDEITEAILLEKVNEGFSSDFWEIYYALIAKRQAYQITATEIQELIIYTDQLEQANAKRLENLSKLAQLRDTNLIDLMKQLDIQPPSYA